MEAGDPSRAAIGTLSAATMFGGQILAHDIQDAQTNVTRFVVLAASKAEPTGDDKTSIAFLLKANVPGALLPGIAPVRRCRYPVDETREPAVTNRDPRVCLPLRFPWAPRRPGIAETLSGVEEECSMLEGLRQLSTLSDSRSLNSGRRGCRRRFPSRFPDSILTRTCEREWKSPGAGLTEDRSGFVVVESARIASLPDHAIHPEVGIVVRDRGVVAMQSPVGRTNWSGRRLDPHHGSDCGAAGPGHVRRRISAFGRGRGSRVRRGRCRSGGRR